MPFKKEGIIYVRNYTKLSLEAKTVKTSIHLGLDRGDCIITNNQNNDNKWI